MSNNHATPSTGTNRLSALLAIGLVGLILSLIQTGHYYDLKTGVAGFHTFCNLGGAVNCDAVTLSKYATGFLGFPISSFAAGWFLTLAALAYLARNSFWKRDAVRVIFALNSFAVLTSLAYLFIMIAKVQYYCVTCFLVDALNVIAWFIAFSLKPEPLSAARPETSQLKAMGFVLLGAFLITNLGGMIFLGQKEIPEADIQMFVNSIMENPPISIAIPDHSYSRGPKDAKVTIVKFSDFQCPACRMGALLLHPVLQQWGDKVRFVYINFPLDAKCNRQMQGDVHVHACEAAKVGYCMNKMGKFQDVYELFFENQDDMKTTAPTDMALRLGGVNENDLKACVASGEAEKAVIEDVELGIQAKVASTPTFFINGRKIEGAMPPPVWNRVIEALLRAP